VARPALGCARTAGHAPSRLSDLAFTTEPASYDALIVRGTERRRHRHSHHYGDPEKIVFLYRGP
jgi:hypothetical protein